MKPPLHTFRRWRLLEGLTLEACAEMLGVDNSHLSRVERGAAKPSVDLVVRMASLTDGAITQEEILRFATDGR